jgi:hypothetical protein
MVLDGNSNGTYRRTKTMATIIRFVGFVLSRRIIVPFVVCGIYLIGRFLFGKKPSS